MMKRWKSAMLAIALVLALSVCATALAVDYVQGNIPGILMPLEDGTPLVILYGESVPEGQEDDNTTEFLVVVQRESGECVAYLLVTNTTTLLDAILDTGVGEAEEAAWGYNIVVMDDIRASYQENGAWWDIEYLDPETSKLERLMTGVQDTPITSDDCYFFSYCQ
ncbi:MAG: hypothetical protein ACI4O7_05770 [Aristaeellaceae bacterium]